MLIASFLSMAVSGVLCGPDGPTITRYRAEAGQEFPCPVHPEVLHEAATKQRPGQTGNRNVYSGGDPEGFSTQPKVGWHQEHRCCRWRNDLCRHALDRAKVLNCQSDFERTQLSQRLRHERRTPGKTVMHSSREDQPTFGKTTGLVYSSRQAPDGEIDALQICSFSRD